MPVFCFGLNWLISSLVRVTYPVTSISVKLAKGWLGAFCSSVYTVTQAHYTAKSQLKEDLLKEEDDGSFPRVAPALIGGGRSSCYFTRLNLSSFSFQSF